jgi:hypothetical protein
MLGAYYPPILSEALVVMEVVGAQDHGSKA